MQGRKGTFGNGFEFNSTISLDFDYTYHNSTINIK